MKTNKINLGKVSVTIAKEPWDINKDYDRLTIVELENAYCTYISKKPVPSGTDIENTEYWMMFSKYTKTYNSNEGVFNMSKYLKLKDEEDALVKLNLTQAVTNAPLVIKNVGQIITFLDTENVWQQYQYQSDTIDDWNNLLKWKNLNDSSSAPIEEGAQIYNISEYIPGGAKYGQPVYAGVFTIGGTTTPVTQYRFVFGYDGTLGEVSIENKEDTLVILDYDTYDELTVRSYYLFVGNDTDGYYYQTTIDDDNEIPEWISRAFGDVNSLISVVANRLDTKKQDKLISGSNIKTINKKSIVGSGDLSISEYYTNLISGSNAIDDWVWSGDGYMESVVIDSSAVGVKASYNDEDLSGNIYCNIPFDVKKDKHYILSFYTSGIGTIDLTAIDFGSFVYNNEFTSPFIVDGNTTYDTSKTINELSVINTTGTQRHYIEFTANRTYSINNALDIYVEENNELTFYKPLLVESYVNPDWFANAEDIYTTKKQFGVAFKGVAFNSTTKNIEFTCVDNTKKYLDATDFVKDGMVSSVAIVNGNLVITFNTDSGKEAISIPLTDIFDPDSYYTKTQTDDFLGNKVDKEQGKGLSTNDYTNNDKSKLSALPTNSELTTLLNGKANKNEMSIVPGTGTNADKTTITLKQDTSTTVLTAHQDISGKADISSLASVATSGSYNDLSDKPTIQDLATEKTVYALDNTNPDYPSMRGAYVELHKTCSFGAISIIDITPEGVEVSFTNVTAQSYSEATFTIDNTTYTSYRYNITYFMGLRVPFFVANVAQYGNDYTFGVIKFTSTNNGVFKVHAIGVTPSNCTITVNGVTTPSLDPDMVAVQVNAGDVVKVITTTTTADYYVRIIGFVLEGVCGVSVFVNDAGYLTAHQDISGKANKNEMSVVPGTGVNADKTTITLKQGTSATVLTTHQDVSGKENAMPITTATGATLTAVVGNYYRLNNVGTLAITLPTIVGATKLQSITFMIACSSSAFVTFVPQGTETILKQEGFVLEDNTTYEVTALWNGSEWTLSRVIYE